MSQSTPRPRAAKTYALLGAALLLALLLLLGWFLNTPSPAPTVAVPTPSAPPPQPSELARQQALPLAQLALEHRQGRCRGLYAQLLAYAEATDTPTLEHALKGMSLLTGEMMNGYVAEAPPAGAATQAEAVVFTREGMAGIHAARNGLLTTLRAARTQEPSASLNAISDQCMACHTVYLRDQGANIPLPRHKKPVSAP